MVELGTRMLRLCPRVSHLIHDRSDDDPYRYMTLVRLNGGDAKGMMGEERLKMGGEWLDMREC
jgi:hypothetical protein